MGFTLNDQNELILSSGVVQHLGIDEMGNSLRTIESFRVDQKGLVELRSTDISFRYDNVKYDLYGPLNVTGLENSYALRSTYSPDGVTEFENDYQPVSADRVESIRAALMSNDFEQVAIDFQGLIDGQEGLKLKP